MKLFKVDACAPEPEAVRAAADAIRRGELVIFPTETVYGLAADAGSDAAVTRVFEAKGRGMSSALPVQVAGVEDLSRVAATLPEAGRRLAERLWPGPLTLVLPRSPALSALVTAGRETVGVRVPDHPVALALLRELDAPIAATSANVSGREPPTNAEEAINQLGDAVSVVLDAGQSSIKTASTVVDVSVTPPRILRRGAISTDEIQSIVGDVEDIG